MTQLKPLTAWEEKQEQESHKKEEGYKGETSFFPKSKETAFPFPRDRPRSGPPQNLWGVAPGQGHELARRNSIAVQQAFARSFAAAALALDQEDFSVAPDRTLEVNRRKCCIYIRDQYKSCHSGGETTSYRYHLCDCGTIRDMTARGRKDRYIATARCDGLFAVTPLRGPGHDHREDTREMPLEQCRHCRALLREQGMYVEPFSLRAFHARFQAPLPSWAEALEQRLVGADWGD